jgi:hypothetical protein
MRFGILGKIENVEIIAIGNAIRELPRLRKIYGDGRWRKLKGIAIIRLDNSTICDVELHWYEAHGIGEKEIKIKYFL